MDRLFIALLPGLHKCTTDQIICYTSPFGTAEAGEIAFYGK